MPVLERVSVHLGDVIDSPGDPIRHLHFPVDAAISVTDILAGEQMVEVTVTGKEGCSGAALVQGSERSVCLALVQIGGTAVRVSAAALMEALSRTPYLEAALKRYNALVLRHAVLSVGCSQFHAPPERLARWLTAHWHRTGLDTFPFTAPFLAAQAGLEEKVAAEVLDEFEAHGLLKRTRKTITLIDQHALSERACECFTRCKEATDEYLAALADMARLHGGT